MALRMKNSFGVEKVAYIKKNSLSVHRFFYGWTSVITNLAAPVFIYSQTKNIFLAVLFLLAKYIFEVFAVLASRKILTKNPVLSIALHVAFLCLCNIMLLFTDFQAASVIVLALAFGVAEVFYIVALNVIFAVRVHNSLATVIQAPFTLGVLLLGTIRYGFSLTFDFTFWIILVALVFHILSLIPLMLDRQISLLNAAAIEQTAKKPYKDIRRDLFHSSLGLFDGIVFEIIPLYLVFSQNTIQMSILIFAAIEFIRLLFTKAGELLYKKGLYNLAMVLSCGLFFIFLMLAAFLKDAKAVYIFCIGAAAVAPLHFVPEFSAYVKAIKEDNMIHYNQARREFFMSAGKILAPLTYLAFGSFVPVIVLGAFAGIGMLLTSYNK